MSDSILSLRCVKISSYPISICVYLRPVNSKEIIERLRTEMPVLKTRYSVEEIGVFGSYARNEVTKSSDLDVLVKLQRPTFLNLAGLLNYLEQLFHTRVDITTKHKHLSPRFLHAIEKEIIYA